ncbi:MAG: transcriptional repressor [Clostridia bacterium]|nr:transcriptional repressor [Clostridia bacterium]
MSQGKYNTAGREAILEFFRSNPDRQFSADQVFAELSEMCGEKVPGKSTVYRLLSKLSEEGTILPYRDGGSANCLYQFASKEGGCGSHFHMKCTNCGKIYHLRCRRSEELLCHVLSEHGFKVNLGKSMLYGVCDSCGDTK